MLEREHASHPCRLAVRRLPPLALAFTMVMRLWPQPLSSRRVAAHTRQCLGGRPCSRGAVPAASLSAALSCAMLSHRMATHAPNQLKPCLILRACASCSLSCTWSCRLRHTSCDAWQMQSTAMVGGCKACAFAQQFSCRFVCALCALRKSTRQRPQPPRHPAPCLLGLAAHGQPPLLSGQLQVAKRAVGGHPSGQALPCGQRLEGIAARARGAWSEMQAQAAAALIGHSAAGQQGPGSTRRRTQVGRQ